MSNKRINHFAFEYLSLKDLHSLIQTCKLIQQLTGRFFQFYYTTVNLMCLTDGIYRTNQNHGNKKCIPLRGFTWYFYSIAIENNILGRIKGIHIKYYGDSAVK